MKHILLTYEGSGDTERKTSVALGYFDGVHEGHRALLMKNAECAKKYGLSAAAWTFRGGMKGDCICDEADKLDLMARCGTVSVDIDEFSDICELSPEDFVKEILIERMHIGCAVCGFNFRFGKNASGNADTLASLLSEYSVPLCVVREVKKGGVTVSSSIIKKYINSGDIKSANDFLGREFSICGEVVRGARMGSTIGFPTANISIPKNSVCPLFGVYATKTDVDGKTYFSVTDVGVKPTVSSLCIPMAETHIFGDMRELYGKNIRIYFFGFLREEQKFRNKKELCDAISHDIEKAKAYFGI